jgi:hypothetical protein
VVHGRRRWRCCRKHSPYGRRAAVWFLLPCFNCLMFKFLNCGLNFMLPSRESGCKGTKNPWVIWNRNLLIVYPLTFFMLSAFW